MGDLRCPCGAQFKHSFKYFEHVQESHRGQNIGEVLMDKMKKKFQQFYNLKDEQLRCFDQFEEARQDFEQLINKILKNQPFVYESQMDGPKNIGGSQHTFNNLYWEFLQSFTSNEARKLIRCFMDYLKTFLVESRGLSYWESGPPKELFAFSNDLVAGLSRYQDMFKSMNKWILIEMIYLLNKWMYTNWWTNDKLFKRAQGKREQ